MQIGAVTDTYDYDVFGNLTAQTGDTENDYLYCGEQYDTNTVATIYDTVCQVMDMIRDTDGSVLEVAWAIGRGILTGIFINKMCALKTIGPVVSKLVIGFGIISQVTSIFDAVDDNRWDLVAARTIQLIAMVVSLGQSCFTGDTLVATEDGQKRIDEIEVGDKVWAYNVETGETELKEVTKIYVHEVDEILHLYTTEGQIDTTTNHPFYVVDKGWVAAGDLEAGDEVYQLDGTTAVVVGSEVEKLEERILVYNLEVEDFHSYFVGDEPVLVHNYKEDNKPDGGGTPNGESGKETVSSNKNNDYDNTPSKNHSSTTENPVRGQEPNSSVDIYDKDGNIVRRRWFDSDGNAQRDLDYTNHGNPKEHPEWPHEHLWDWDKRPPRQ